MTLALCNAAHVLCTSMFCIMQHINILRNAVHQCFVYCSTSMFCAMQYINVLRNAVHQCFV